MRNWTPWTVSLLSTPLAADFGPGPKGALEGCAAGQRYFFPTFLSHPESPTGGDQAGSAHIVKAPAFSIPSGGEGLVYSLIWCWDLLPSIPWPPVERPVSERSKAKLHAKAAHPSVAPSGPGPKSAARA